MYEVRNMNTLFTTIEPSFTYIKYTNNVHACIHTIMWAQIYGYNTHTPEEDSTETVTVDVMAGAVSGPSSD